MPPPGSRRIEGRDTPNGGGRRHASRLQRPDGLRERRPGLHRQHRAHDDRDAEGRQVWDMDGWAFLEGPCPDTANPSLWRQGQLNCRHGLYEVTDGIYQVRGLRPVEHDAGRERPRRHRHRPADLEGDGGGRPGPVPLAPRRPAGHGGHLHPRPHRPLRRGARRGRRRHRVPILAPEHFMEHAVSENVYAGTAMLRRGDYYGGCRWPRAPGTSAWGSARRPRPAPSG